MVITRGVTVHNIYGSVQYDTVSRFGMFDREISFFPFFLIFNILNLPKL